jgi:iron complex outermembrane receptor protein
MREPARNTSRLLARSLWVGAAAVALAPQLARAQAASPPSPAPTTLGEVVVTAQKRAEKLQDVPVSVNVISSEAIEKSHVGGFEELQQLSPSVSFTPSANARGQGLSIRGIGTLNFSDGIEPSVSVVVDGVVIGRSAAAFFDFNDVQRIEVLRGPQGMLFGKNASAGVINVVTSRPSLETPAFDASASYASFREARDKVSASIPLKEGELAVGLQAFYNKSEGLVTNVVTGKKYNGRNSDGVRGKLEWDPSDSFQLYVAADYALNMSDCCVTTVRSILPTTRYYGPTGPTRSSLYAGVEVGRFSRQVAFDGAYYGHYNTEGASVEMDKQLPGVNITSITAYRRFHDADNNDSDLTVLPVASVNDAFQKQTQFSEELRLSSPNGARLEYVAGLFYFDQKVATHTDVFGDFGLTRGVNFGSAVDRAITTRNYAAFGQATWHVTDALRVIGGLRYTKEDIRGYFVRSTIPGTAGPYPALGGPPLDAQGLGAKDSDVSYRAGVQYNLAPRVMAYATYSKGYKGAGLNMLNNLSAADVSTGRYVLRPEIAKNLEAGLRMTPASNLTLNVTLYRTVFDDFQAQTFNSVLNSFTLSNAGSLKSTGVEVEAQYAPVSGLNLTGNLAYQRTRIENYRPGCYPGQTAALGCQGAFQDVTGLPLANAPKLSYTLAADYRTPLGESAFDLDLNASYAYRSSVFFSYRDPNTIQPAYGIVNASVSLRRNDGRYELQAFVRNLGDQRFLQGVTTGFLDSSAAGAGYLEIYNQDAFRTVGVEAKVHF